MSTGPISPISGLSSSSNATVPQHVMDEEHSTTVSGRLDRPLSMSMYSTLPEAVPRPLESEKQVAGDEGKEVVASDGKEAAFISTTGDLTYPGSPELPASKPEQPFAGETYREYDGIAPDGHPALASGSGEQKKRRKIFGLTPLIFGAIIGGIVILAIALGVGLGVGLNTNKNNIQPTSTSSGSAFTTSLAPSATPTVVGQTLIGGAVNPQYFSTQGVFNGTGLDINSAEFISDYPGFNNSNGQVIVYFQHYTGQLRWAGLNATGWFGGGPNQVIATDAKNNTPVSAAAYHINTTDYWRLYYINNQNLVRERVLSAATGNWTDGTLNKLNVKALNDERVGLLNCYYANPSQDTEFAGNYGIGLRLWVASNATTFQELGWSATSDAWTYGQQWPGLNGHAAPLCYSWGGSTTYVAFVDLANRVNFFWRDTSAGVAPTESHPINQWVNTSVTVPNVNPSTQLQIGVFASNIIWAQSLQDDLIHGYNVSWAAENTTVNLNTPITVSGPGGSGAPINGTSIALTVLPQLANETSPRIILFDQTVGNEVSVFTQYQNDLVNGAGSWNQSSVKITAS